MVGVKGRSGIAKDPEKRARLAQARALGGLRTKQRWQESIETPIDQELAIELRETARKYGLPAPQTVEEAIKLKDFLIREEKREKLQIDREYMLSTRIDVNLVDDYVSRLALVMNKALDTVHHALDDSMELNEEQQVIARRRLREWAESVSLALSQEEVYERDNRAERSEPAQPGESEQPVAEAPEEVPIEED
jgi:hypothetical protein